MFDNRDWCDVDSDEDYRIPELPPLPADEMPFKLPVDKEVEEEVKYSRIVTPFNPHRFHFDLKRETSSKEKIEKRGYVCFVGKFPSETNLTDLECFVKSRGISFTEVRMGPKKKPNLNAFGYVDVPTRKDYDLLLSFDGTIHRGRAIRVDHATRKEKSNKASCVKKVRMLKEELTPTPAKSVYKAKSYNHQSRSKKVDVHPKKSNCRFQRFKTLRKRKTGTRNKHKYKKEQKSFGAKKKQPTS